LGNVKSPWSPGVESRCLPVDRLSIAPDLLESLAAYGCDLSALPRDPGFDSE
jgi:hypothetical protein